MGLTRRNFTKNLFVSSLAVPLFTLAPKNLFASVTYVVKSGDTLSRIAQQNGTTVSKIKRLNQLKSDLIKIGQKLQLPDPNIIPTETQLATSSIKIKKSRSTERNGK